MPVLIFIQIGLVAGSYALANAIPAAMDQKKAEKINARANELLRSITTDGRMQEAAFELEPITPVLKRKISAGMKAGVLTAFGAYAAAGGLAAIGRNLAMSRFGGIAEKYTILSVLGDGSLAAETAVLAGIAAGTVGAVLGVPARKKAEENLERAYSNLFQAKNEKRKYFNDEWNCQDREKEENEMVDYIGSNAVKKYYEENGIVLPAEKPAAGNEEAGTGDSETLRMKNV